MASADDALNEVTGAQNVHVVKLWKNVAAWAKDSSNVRSIQDKVSRMARELMEEASFDYDEGLPGARTPMGIRNAVFRILREATMWLPRRSQAELDAKKSGRDTVLGHAIDAASYGQLNNELLQKIAKKLDIE